jgi:hypothetical protein
MARLVLSLVMLTLGCGRTQLYEGLAAGGSGGAGGGSPTGGSGGAGGGGSPTVPSCLSAGFDAGSGEGFVDAPPPAALVQAMTWDEAHRRVVAFTQGQTWEWNGSGWKHHTAGPHPASLFYAAMAWDGVGCRVLLFGGALTPYADASQQLAGLDQTWAWDGEHWTQLHPANAPSARSHHAMAWDPTRQRIVLFGGQDDHTPILGDTWEWTGSTWEQASPVQSPPVSAGHAMAFDGVTQRVMAAATNGVLTYAGTSNGAWEWTGYTWLRVAEDPAAPPACWNAATMAADPIRSRVVWLCGSSNQTWEWNGAVWKLSFGSFLGTDFESALAWDGHAGRVLALVPFQFTPPLEPPQVSWWNGAAWSPR